MVHSTAEPSFWTTIHRRTCTVSLRRPSPMGKTPWFQSAILRPVRRRADHAANPTRSQALRVEKESSSAALHSFSKYERGLVRDLRCPAV